MTITPISPSTEPPVRSTSSSNHDSSASGGFADILGAAQGRTADDDRTPSTNSRDNTSSSDASDGTDATNGTGSTDASDATDRTDNTGDDDTNDDDTDDPQPDASATGLLNVTVTTVDLLQPETTPTTEVVAPVNAADVTAALAGNATGVPATAAETPTVPVAEAMPAAPAAEAKAAVATAADAALAAHAKAAADMKGAADVKTATDTPPPATDDTTPPANPPANGDTPPATPATDATNANANDAAPEVPLVPIEPALPATASETRSEIASVAAALSALESPVEATAPAHTAAPRSAPAPIETAATAIAPNHAAAVSPMAQPQHAVATQAAATEVVHAPATSTPTQPHEQVVAVLSPLSQRPDGVYKLRLELHPAELGRVEIDVEMRNGVLHANLRAEHVTAAHALRDALADLRGRLDAQGVRTGNVTVDGRGPGNAGRERQSASSGEARRGDGGPDGREERLLDEQRSRRANDVNASMLDLRM